MSSAKFIAKYLTPFLNANALFGTSLLGWIVVQTIGTTLKPTDATCNDSSVAWASLLLGGMFLALLAGLGDLYGDITRRFRREHVCILGYEDDGEYKPFPNIYNIMKVPDNPTVGAIVFDEEKNSSTSKLYRVEMIDDLGPAVEQDFTEMDIVGSLVPVPEIEKDEGGRLLDRTFGSPGRGGDESGDEEKPKNTRYAVRIQGLKDTLKPPPGPKQGQLTIQRYVGTSGTSPTEIDSTDPEVGGRFNGGIIRTPKWLLIWSCIRCMTSVLFMSFLVFVTTIPVFTGDCSDDPKFVEAYNGYCCQYQQSQRDPSFVGTAVMAFFISMALKFSMPGLPAKGEKKTPYEMDNSIGWIWYPGFEEEMHPDVYNARWLGLRSFNWNWRVVFYCFAIFAAGIPFFCFYTWGAFNLWSNDGLIYEPIIAEEEI